MAWPLAAMLAGAAVETPGRAVVVSAAADRKSVALTVYNQGRGLVHETRVLALAAGVSEVRFADVAEKIEPATVRVGVVQGGGLSVLEQNYQYDLLTPQKLLEKFVGQTLRLEERGADGEGEAREVSGRLLSTSGGTVWEIDGRIVTNPGFARVVFPSVPANFVTRPTLAWLVEAPVAGTRTVEAAYVTGGLSWRADYVLSLDARETRAALNGWVTIENDSGAGYENAALKLVAGDLRYAPPDPRGSGGVSQAMAVAERAASMAREGLFEYHLYTLPRPTTLAQKETKQVQLLDAPGFAVGKEYVLRTGRSYREAWTRTGPGEKVAVMVTFRNTEAAGLGLPIPKGIVRVYKRDSAGVSQLVGEDRVDHTPRGEQLRLEVGAAFDIAAERRQTDFKRMQVAPYDYESAYEIRLRNRKAEPVVVRVIEPIGGEWSILESTYPAKKTAAFEAEFQIPVAVDEEAVLAYRVRVKH